MSCSIHLGNYILVVQPPTVKDHGTNVIVPNKTAGSAQEDGKNKMGALDFELSWLRFLREAEEDYQKRLTRNDKQQPLSIFEVNVDIFESYLLRVSGRALAATQHLNLNITSAMGSHLRIFDNQQPEAPSDLEEEQEQEDELDKRRAQRKHRRVQRRRITASFTLEETKAAALQIAPPSPLLVIKQKAVLQDSLNDRSDDEEDEPNRSQRKRDQLLIQDEEEDLDRDDVMNSPEQQQQYHQQTAQFNQQTVVIQPLIEIEQLMENSAPMKSTTMQGNLDSMRMDDHNTLREFRSSNLCPDSIIKTEGEDLMNHPEAKIMIGDQSIDENFGELLLNGDGQAHYAGHSSYQDMEEINEDEINANPFREKGAPLQAGSTIVSQGSHIEEGQQLTTEAPADINHMATFEKELTNQPNLIRSSETDLRSKLAGNQSPEGQEPPAVITKAQLKSAQVSPIAQVKESVLDFQPEKEVIMRFEVALNSSPDMKKETHETADVGCGNTPVNLTLQEINQSELREEEVISGSEIQDDGDNGEMGDFQQDDEYDQEEEYDEGSYDQQNYIYPLGQGGTNSQNTSIDMEGTNKHASRLEVTLTAEPDKPIMVEVRGGEKQFLISALTKHIYEILSQPHRLQMLRDEAVSEQDYSQHFQEGDGQQDYENTEQQQQQQQQQPKKNMNLKLRSLKKNLQRGNNKQQPVMFDTQTRNEMLPNLAANPTNAITIDQLDQSSKFEDEASVIRSKKPPTPRQEEIISVLPDISNNVRSSVVQAAGGAAVQAPKENIKHNAASTRAQMASPLTNPSQVEVELSGRKTPITKSGTAEFKTRTDTRYQDQNSKRTVTEEAFADAKIREETRLTHVFDNTHDLIETQFDKEIAMADSRRPRPPNSQNRRLKNISSSSQHSQPRNSQEHLEQFIRSRPETANFNNNEDSLPPINNIRSSQAIIHPADQKQHIPKTPNQQHIVTYADDEMLLTSTPSQNNNHHQRGRRAMTPDGNKHTSIVKDTLSQQAPSDIEHFSLPPLQAQMPLSNDQQYFQADNGDYLMGVQDSQTFGHSMTSDTTGGHQHHHHQQQQEYNPNQITYYEAYPGEHHHHQMMMAAQQMPEGYYQGNPYNQGQQQQYQQQQIDQSNADDYILAEGYPLQYRMAGTGTGGNPTMYKQSRPAAAVAGRDQKAMIFTNPHNQAPLSRNHTHNFSNTHTNGFNRTNASNTSVMQNSNSKQQMMYPYPHQGVRKQLPVVKATKKRMFGNHSQNNTIYSMNGGPAFRPLAFTPTRSLSPLRRKNTNNGVFYTQNNYSTNQPQQTLLLQQQQQQQYEELAAYYAHSQSPQRNGAITRNSPYMSDDEFKILHNYYDIQCEPTGLHRGGVPLMRVKRINRPKQRTFNIFNFADEQNNVALPKALSSLQIFYPQYQPNQFQQDYLQRTLANTPSKWFDRFYQSTRNLNQTINNLHKQHSRKLRSYSVSSLSSGGEGGLRGSSQDQQQQPAQALFTKQQMREIREHAASMPQEQMDLAQNSVQSDIQKRQPSSTKGGPSNSIFMPPLHKIYTNSGNNNVSHDNNNNMMLGGTAKKNKLPPRPKAKGAAMAQSTKELPLKEQQSPTRSIINTNHNQYVCVGVNIITKSSDK